MHYPVGRFDAHQARIDGIPGLARQLDFSPNRAMSPSGALHPFAPYVHMAIQPVRWLQVLRNGPDSIIPYQGMIRDVAWTSTKTMQSPGGDPMSLETVWRSMNSDMSRRTMASSLPK